MLGNSSKVLVLNRSWIAVGITTLESAITKVCSFYKDGTPKAKIIDCVDDFQSFNWSDWSKIRPDENKNFIQTVNNTFKIPEIIQFTKYDKTPSRKVHYNRRTIFLRDNNQCQYCASKVDLTLDHLIPKCQGGLTTWENVVAACVKCNLKKAGRTPKEAKMSLLKKPIKPKLNPLSSSVRVKSWEHFLGEMYYVVELDNDNLK